MLFFRNAAKDAQKIQNKINYKILKAAWDSYTHLNQGECQQHRMATPAWYALFSIINFKGDFKKFDLDDFHLLKSLQNVNETYDKIIDALDSNAENEDLARHIMNTNPDLQSVVPAEYDNVDKINIYIASVIKAYELMLQNFCDKYKDKIDSQIAVLEVLSEKQEQEELGNMLSENDADL